MEVTWTNQHGCGYDVTNEKGPLKVNCNVVLQYMCQENKDEGGDTGTSNVRRDLFREL